MRPENTAKLGNEYLYIIQALSHGKSRVTDKMPENFRNLGLLRGIFPNAKFIHCRRNAVDTCLSIYMQSFTNLPAYANDKSDLVFVYQEYLRLMNHWRTILPEDALIEINYEDLFSNQEGISRELIDFCGLEWEEACMHPERNQRPVFTASHWQVRQPVYRTSLDRRKKYEPWLGPLALLAGDASE